jgi:choline/glycine/proline betaine transport protein
MLVPTLVTFLWFAVLGGTALWMQLNGVTDFVQSDGSVDVEGALFQMLAQLVSSPLAQKFVFATQLPNA